MKSEPLKITARCPIRTTSDLIGGKWKLLILFQLSHHPLRLSELKRLIPDVSDKMLIQDLKTLCDNKLVSRESNGEYSTKINYELTSIGRKIIPLIAEMRSFAIEYENDLS